MKLPRGEEATIRPEKITEYALSPDHPIGKHKARVFKALFGLTPNHADLLLEALRSAASQEAATLGRADAFGQRYTVDFNLTGPNGNTATIRSAWIVRDDEPPDLVTCFIL